ncbi:MAG: pilus assembly protein PilM [Alphaproteobacteria bacterium]|nr:pilus assembly protein PilM [Alphaproteobacteria bacterium]MBN2779808.1 pilus assembly protein PilM [Alphaproteobacteria bacterium]
MRFFTVFECGATRIKALTIEKSPKGLVPHAMVTRDVDCFKNGLITNPVVFLTAIKDIRDTLDAKLICPVESITLGISGLATQSKLKMSSMRFSEPRAIVHEDILTLLKQQEKQIQDPLLHCLPMRYKVDERTDVENPEGLIAGEFGVASHLVSIPASVCQMYETLFRKVGLKIDYFVAVPYALSLAALSQRQKKEGVLLIDIGKIHTHVALWTYRTPFFFSSLPLGGDLITKDIQQIFQVSFEEANRVKEQYGRAWVLPEDHLKNIEIGGKTRSLLDLTRVIHMRAKETFELIRAFLDSKTQLGPVKEIVLTGGGCKIPYMREMAHNVFHRPVSIAQEFKWQENSISNVLYGLVLYKNGLKPITKEQEEETQNLVEKLHRWIKEYL